MYIIFIVMQTRVLEKLARMNPGVHWWLKGNRTEGSMAVGCWEKLT